MSDPRYPIGRFVPPATFDAPTRERLVDEIAAAPARLRVAVSGLSAEQLAERYREGGWTLKQVVHHVADSHVNAYVRFKLAATEDEPLVKTYEEQLWAELPDATSADLSASLALLDALHARWVAFLRSLSEAQLQRTFRHPDHGLVTLNRNLALYAWHGRHHAAHVTSTRERMGW